MSTSTGAGGSGSTSSSSTSGNTGTLALYAFCKSDNECMSGKCPMGFCTKDCTKVSDCEFSKAECVDFKGIKQCLPVCKLQTDCDPYMIPSECGFSKAVDDWPVTVCADWLGDLAYPPKGTECKVHEDCNLGHVGVEKVCGKFTLVCIEAACYSDKDCKSPKKCSQQTGSLGSCG